jgi:hypothetical protein
MTEVFVETVDLIAAFPKKSLQYSGESGFLSIDQNRWSG